MAAVTESVSLASLTTLKVGGPASIVATCRTLEDVKAAIALARDRGLPWYVLGGGSNILAADTGFTGVIIHFAPSEGEAGITFEERGDCVLAVANAYVVWDTFVRTVASHNLWGIENLAGIPGTVGAAPVQNIGAYGTEVKDTLAWVEVLHGDTLELEQIGNESCGFTYRESKFKHDKSLIILRVAFMLQKNGTVQTGYKDIAAGVDAGEPAATPQEVGDMVRGIRANKFPDLEMCGTAGSFFKNPRVSKDEYELLKQKYPELPGFFDENEVKIPLAWILDNVLHLRGYTSEHVGLFERQPLVLVTAAGASAEEVDLFARDIEAKVLDATDITIEREVQMLFS